MRLFHYRYRFLLLPLSSFAALLSAALVAACSDDVEPGVTPAEDSGADVVSPTLDSGPPADVQADAGGRDCAVDRDTDGLAKHLECAGLYEDFATKKIASTSRPFTPGLEFWSDGAEKRRFVYLPPNTTIDIANFDEWKLPTGIRLFKEFKVEGKLIETRLFEKTTAGWKHATYRWNAAETDAVRKQTGERIELAGRTPYEIPKPEDCDFCHAGRAEPVLGFDAVSLGVSTAHGVTLDVLATENRLSPAPPTKTITIPNDETNLATPAIGWLHANCGHCHNDSPAAAAFGASLRMLVRPSHLGFGGADAGAADAGDGGVKTAHDLSVYLTGVCKVSERDGPTGGKYLFIAGGSPTLSLADVLLSSRATPGMESIANQMPPIITHMVDAVGKKKVDDWITALPICP